MILTDIFWKRYELDLQEVKLAYLNWAVDYAKEPGPGQRNLFLWEHQQQFCLIDSRYGRAFAMSPFGVGVRGVPRNQTKGIDEYDSNLKERLSVNTRKIRSTITNTLDNDDLQTARETVLNYFWLKLGSHELLFDRIQYRFDESDKRTKGRWGEDESEGIKTLNGIRNRIVNVIRYGEKLEDDYVASLNERLPGFSRNAHNTFVSSAMTWNKYGLCTFDCGPVLWSKKGFVHFRQVKERMNQIGWPYKSTARELLKSLYTIAVDYRRPPIRIRGEPEEGYSRKSLRRRRCQIYELIDNTFNKINMIRGQIMG